MTLQAVLQRQEVGKPARVVPRVLRALLIGVLGGWLAIVVAGGARLALGPVTVIGTLRPAWSGSATLELPPAGSLSAQTHRAPLALTVRVEEVHVAPLLRLAKSSMRDAVPAWVRPNLTRLAHAVLLRALLAAVLGAALCGLLLGLRGRYWLTGVLAGVAGLALPLALAALTFRPHAFADARYTGELARAPALLRLARLDLDRYAAFEGSLWQATTRADRLYKRMNGAPAVPDSALTRVLLISDLHNNPLGLQLARELTKAYDAKLVLVTGDVSDLGHPLEAGLLAAWDQFRLPVVVVTGNHDSRAIAARLQRIGGVSVLEDGARVRRAGLVIAGYGDPHARRDGMGNAAYTAGELAQLTRRMQAGTSAKTAPDILLVHNNDVARRVLGRAPVVLCGHSHVPLLLRQGTHLLINPGTTGAGGVRYFTAPHPPASGAAVLSFTTGRTPRLRYVDFIAVRQVEGTFTVQRRDLARWTDGNVFRPE